MNRQQSLFEPETAHNPLLDVNLSHESGSALRPETPADVQEILQENARHPGQKMAPVGGGTSLCLPGDVIPLSTSRLTRVVDYPHRDLTITVEAGLTLAELRRILAEHGQRLPLDAPHADQATLGGLLATNTSGPGRFGYGTFRDYVIGISAVDGLGRSFSAGGRVVKNVAGYDLCKLLIGSQGSLAVITQLTLKLRPLARSRQFVCASFNAIADLAAALDALNTSQTRPAVLESIRTYSDDWRNELRAGAITPGAATESNATFVLCIAFEGTDTETDWQVQTVLQELAPHQPASLEQFEGADAASLWDDLTTAMSRRAGLSVHVAFPPSQTAAFLERVPHEAPVQWHAGDGVATCLISADDALEQVRTLRGSLIEMGARLWVPDAPLDWALSDRLALEPGVLEIHRRIKSVLDPGHHLYANWLGE